jgi:1,2-diacylglycerol 3-beta-galactosyltransferase
VVVVCGRNEKLRETFEQASWDVPVALPGFVDNLHELMAGADVLITKGGPGSIMEGCVAGLPILIYDRLPGQEVGNVRLVEARGIGHYVPDPLELTAALARWLEHPDEREQAARASRAAGTPDSALRIAREILRLATDTQP